MYFVILAIFVFASWLKIFLSLQSLSLDPPVEHMPFEPDHTSVVPYSL